MISEGSVDCFGAGSCSLALKVTLNKVMVEAGFWRLDDFWLWSALHLAYESITRCGRFE